MPRPKGSKNRKTAVVVEAVENIDEKIAAVEAEIATLTGELKAKKAELKKLNKAKDKADKLAAEKRAEENRAMLLEAITASGKSIDEVLELLKK